MRHLGGLISVSRQNILVTPCTLAQSQEAAFYSPSTFPDSTKYRHALLCMYSFYTAVQLRILLSVVDRLSDGW